MSCNDFGVEYISLSKISGQPPANQYLLTEPVFLLIWKIMSDAPGSFLLVFSGKPRHDKKIENKKRKIPGKLSKLGIIISIIFI